MLETLFLHGFMSKEPYNTSKYIGCVLDHRDREIVEILRNHNIDFTNVEYSHWALTYLLKFPWTYTETGDELKQIYDALGAKVVENSNHTNGA